MIYYCLRRQRRHKAEGSDNWQWFVVRGSQRGSWARSFNPDCLFDDKMDYGMIKEARKNNPDCKMIKVRIEL